MEEERQVRIVVFHVSKVLQSEVEERGFGFNAYDAFIQQEDGSETLEEFLAISIPVDLTGIDLASVRLDEHAVAKALGVPPIEDWDWHFEICSDDALPAGTYWIGDPESVAGEAFAREIPGFDEVLADTRAGDLIRSIHCSPGLFFSILPCKNGITAYVDADSGDTYATRSRCIGIMPKSLMSERLTDDMDTGGDYLTAPLEISIQYDYQQGAILFGSDELGSALKLVPCER